VDELLPFLRKAIAEYLHVKGFTQTQIAQMLNVSQPAVSYYLKQNRPHSKYASEFIKERSIELAEALMTKLIDKGMGRGEAHEYMRKISIKALQQDKCLSHSG